MAQKTLDVKGMTCNHCKMAVTNALKELDGVQDVDVNLETGKVNVTFEDGKVTDAQMKEAIEDQGYEVA